MPEARRLDEAMSARRLDLRMNWREIAAAAGISYAALRAIRKGEYRPTALTARGLDHAFRWEPGSVERVLDGGDPIPLGAGGLPREHSPPTQLTDEDVRERIIAEALKGLTPDEVERVWRNVRDHFQAEVEPEVEPPGEEPRRRSAG